jgi:hypothetical protein
MRLALANSVAAFLLAAALLGCEPVYSPLYSPAAPTDLAALTQPDGSIHFTWTDNASNEDSYQLQRST